MADLILDSIEKTFGSTRVLDPCSIKFSHGQFICFLGPSGCGKTTLLRMIAGLERPSRGRILLDKEDITEQPAHLRGFGMVFQSLVLFPHLTIGGNVAYPLRLRGVPREKCRERVVALLQLFHLDGRENEPVQRLSGGERQRVAIARALAGQPSCVLADEPTGNLDRETADGVFALMRELTRQHGMAFVMVTHDESLASRCDRALHLKHGRLVA